MHSKYFTEQIYDFLYLLFGKLTNFEIFTIWEINEFLKFYNFENPYFTVWKIIEFFWCSNTIISKKWKNRYENKNIE